jgi:hypothetical protein
MLSKMRFVGLLAIVVLATWACGAETSTEEAEESKATAAPENTETAIEVIPPFITILGDERQTGKTWAIRGPILPSGPQGPTCDNDN